MAIKTWLKQTSKNVLASHGGECRRLGTVNPAPAGPHPPAVRSLGTTTKFKAKNFAKVYAHWHETRSQKCKHDHDVESTHLQRVLVVVPKTKEVLLSLLHFGPQAHFEIFGI